MAQPCDLKAQHGRRGCLQGGMRRFTDEWRSGDQAGTADGWPESAGGKGGFDKRHCTCRAQLPRLLALCDRACLAAPPFRVQVRGASPHASQGAVLPLQPGSAALRPILHLRSRLPGVAASAPRPLAPWRQSRTQPNASRPPSPCPPSTKLADCVQRHEPEPGGPWRRVQQRVELPRAARGWLAAQTTQQSSLGP